MQISPKYEAFLNSLAGKRFLGQGYEIKILSPWAIRYREGDCTLTLGSEVHVRGDKRKNWFLGIYVEDHLKWDNEAKSASITAEKAGLILARVEDALKSEGESYELIRRSRL